MKIAGIIILFNPGLDTWKNILSYINEVDLLFALDNSEIYNNDLIKNIQSIDKIKYINNFGNKGIAFALNKGARLAIDENCDWLLTMDQDSLASEGMVDYMKQFIQIFDKIELLAIVSPFHSLLKETSEEKESCFYYKGFRLKYRLSVMTSGNLLNLKLFSIIGDFEEELFMDYVDHEYCLRANILGYKIVELIDIYLEHRLGETELRNSLIQFYTTNHNYIRRYYITRNRFYLYNKYKDKFSEFCKNDYKSQIKEWVKILVGEKDKIRKIKSIIRGIQDYRRGKFGKYEYFK
jgi:rhamnosyltransferase